METPATLVPLRQMARIVGVPVDWLRSEAEAGRVPCLRAGPRLLFAPDAVEQSLAERAATPTDPPLRMRLLAMTIGGALPQEIPAEGFGDLAVWAEVNSIDDVDAAIARGETILCWTGGRMALGGLVSPERRDRELAGLDVLTIDVGGIVGLLRRKLSEHAGGAK